MSQDIKRQLDPIFMAKTVAVYGASNRPRKWGYSIVERLVKSGFPGAIYPVNPRETEILGQPVYPSIFDVPKPVDLVVFTVPAASVPQAMRDCIAHGVRGALVISAGFAEVGEEGQRLQDEVVAIAREGGIRFVGPNCNGIWSSAAHLCLFEPRAPRAGPIALVSQSGVFGGYLAQLAEQKGYGLSKFISAGNQADLQTSDYLEYLAEDEDTRVIVLYVEGFKEGRRFLEVAREVVKRKPIVVYKAGRTTVGQRAVMSHTGSMMVEDNIFDAACRQAGLIRSYEAVFSFDMAEALAYCRIPRGRRVAVICISGGQGVVASDTCAFLGLEVPELDDETKNILKREHLAPHAPVPRNPIDLAGDLSTPLLFGRVAQLVAPLSYIDIIIMNSPQVDTAGGDPQAAGEARQAAEIIASIPSRWGKPVILLQIRGRERDPFESLFKGAGIVSYETPEECARAAFALARYGEVRRGL